jgi:hypothetical protein
MNLGFMSMGVQMKSFFEWIFEDAKVAWNLALDHPLGIGPLKNCREMSSNMECGI